MSARGARHRPRLAFPCCLLLALTTGWPGSRAAQPAQPQALVFHHAHYHVGDPSAAMSEAVRRVEGVRVIVPGMGVGVRAGREFLLFDRLDEDSAGDAGQAAATAFPLAAAKLEAAGFTVVPEAVSHVKVATVFADLPVHHLAFAADDLPRAAQRILDTGATVLLKRDDSVLFAVEGIVIEIVRDTTRPDVYWCPMHPDVRAADPITCLLCGMDLVPIPPPKVGEYKLDVDPERNPRDQTIRALRFQVREPETNASVGRFATVHEKLFHLFVISRDLEFFDHVHPEQQADGSFRIAQALPPGEYMLIADFLPEGGTPQMVQRAIISGRLSSKGAWRSRTAAVTAQPAESAVVDGLRVTLDAAAPVVGKELPLTFTVADVRTGEPVTDLQPFLGAPAHLLIVRSDLADAIHAHPEEQATGGPTVSFHPLVPSAGEYRLWIQFQRAGRVITVPFDLPAAR